MLPVLSIASTVQYLERSSSLLVNSALDLPLGTYTVKCCSVVLGVTLMLRVINTSSFVSREQ